MILEKEERRITMIRNKLISLIHFGERKNTTTTDDHYALNHKIDLFIEWYYETFIKGKQTKIGEVNSPKQLRCFIEKMAVWYEMRYPNYEIRESWVLENFSPIKLQADKLLIMNNVAIERLKEMLTEQEKQVFEASLGCLSWKNFLSTKAFLDSLTPDEKGYLSSPGYSGIAYITDALHSGHLHLSTEGTIIDAECIRVRTRSFTDEDLSQEFIGMPLKDVIKKLKERNALPESNGLEKAVLEYNNQVLMKNGVLDCVMYRIIERGGNVFGPRRGYMFAKEFGRSIDIPIMYGINYSDYELGNFIRQYLDDGGNPNLQCYVHYHSRISDKAKLVVTSPIEALTRLNEYTTEEIKIRRQNSLQGFYNITTQVLAQRLEKEQETVAQKRLQRRLEKARIRTNQQ
jgi:hypothetical protein